MNEPDFLEEFNKFYCKDGILLFFLKAILNRDLKAETRRHLAYLLQQNIDNDTETYQKVGAWFPV